MATIGVNKRPEDFNFYGITPGEGPKFQRLQGTGQVDKNVLGMIQGFDPVNSNPFFDAYRQGFTLTPQDTFGQIVAGGGATAGGDTGGMTSGWADMGSSYRPQDYLAGRNSNFGDGPGSRMKESVEMVDWFDNKGKNLYTDVVNDQTSMSGENVFSGMLKDPLFHAFLGLTGAGMAFLPGGALSGAFGSGAGAAGSGAGFVGEGAASGIGAWDAALGGSMLEGAGAAGAGAAAGGASGGLSSLLGGLGSAKSWLPVAATVLGGLAGSQGKKESVTQSKELPPYLVGPVTGKNGLLSSADRLMQSQLYGTPMGLLK